MWVCILIVCVVCVPQGPQSAADGENKKLLRSRTKQRNFDKAWSTYTAAFQTYYNNLSRDQKTEFVNNSIVYSGKRRLENRVMINWEAAEHLKRSKERDMEYGTSGCIQEQAETLLGGPARLHAAVARGLLVKGCGPHPFAKYPNLWGLCSYNCSVMCQGLNPCPLRKNLMNFMPLQEQSKLQCNKECRCFLFQDQNLQ